MNKSEFVSAIAQEADLSSQQAKSAVDAFISVVTNGLIEGDKINLTGFGAFSAKTRPEREGRNPATGATITIPEAVVPSFKPGKEFKEALNG